MYLVIYEMDNRLWKEECAGLAQAESFAADLAEDGTPAVLAQVIREIPAEAAPAGTLYAAAGRDYPATLGPLPVTRSGEAAA